MAWKKSVAHLEDEKLIQFLRTKPFVRHSKMNPEQLLDFKPDTTADLIVDGVVGLRSAIVNEIGWSVLPAMSVQSFIIEKKLFKLNLTVHVKDDVSVWWIRARRDLTTNTKFIVNWIADFKVD